MDGDATGKEKAGAPAREHRAERLAAALRANLHRRKAQARDRRRRREEDGPGADGPQDEDRG